MTVRADCGHIIDSIRAALEEWSHMMYFQETTSVLSKKRAKVSTKFAKSFRALKGPTYHLQITREDKTGNTCPAPFRLRIPVRLLRYLW